MAFSLIKRYLELSSKVLEKPEMEIVLFILRYSNCTGLPIQTCSVQSGLKANGGYGEH